MVSSVANAIARLPDFVQVAVIHVEYLKQSVGNAKLVQAFDFHESRGSAFVVRQI